MSTNIKWLDRLLGIKAATRVPLSVPRVSSSERAVVRWLDDDLNTYVTEGYSGNDIVYSIINIAAEKAKVAPWGVYKIKDESSLKAYEAELSKGKDVDFRKALNYRTKALELFTGDGKLNELTQWPNEKETFQDLVGNSMVAKMTTGNRYVYGTLLDGGANQGKPQELHLLPSQWVQIKASQTFPSRVVGYQLMCGEIIPFRSEEIMHDKTHNPNYDHYGADLYGMAPLKAALHNLSRSQSAKAASTASFQNQGPDVIVFVDDERLDADQAVAQAEAVKKKLRSSEYTGPTRNRLAVSGYKMGSTSLGLSPVDLDILNAEKWDVVMLANVFNFPHILLFPEHATYNNQITAEKALTSRCVLPHHVSFRNHFNRKLRNDWGYKDKNIYVDFDLSVYTELQPDMKMMTDWLQKAYWLTIRKRYEAMQIELPDKWKNDAMIDEILVPPGYVSIRDLDPENIDRAMREVEDEDE